MFWRRQCEEERRLRRESKQMNWGAFCHTGEHIGVRKSHKFDGRANGHGAALQCSEGETDPGLPENAKSKLRVGDRVPTGPLDGWL